MRTTQEAEDGLLAIPPNIELRVSELRLRASGVLESLSNSSAFTPLDDFLDSNPDSVELEGHVVLVKISDVHERIYSEYRPGLEWDRSPSDRGIVPPEPHRADDEIRWSAQRNISVQRFSQQQFNDLCTVLCSDVLVRDKLGLGNTFSESDNVPMDWNPAENKGFYQEKKQQWEAPSFLIIRDGALLPAVIGLSGLSKIDTMRRTHKVFSGYRSNQDAAISLPPIQLNLQTPEAICQTPFQRFFEQARKFCLPNAHGMDQYYRGISAQVIFSQGVKPPIPFSDSEDQEIRNYYRPTRRCRERNHKKSDKRFAGYGNVHEWREATFGDVKNTRRSVGPFKPTD